MKVCAFCLVPFTILVVAATATASNPGKRATGGSERSCYECHQETLFKSWKYVHAPVASDACTFCHKPHTPEKGQLGLRDRVSDLCFGCHDQENYKISVVHLSRNVLCTKCHSPHGGDNYSLVKESVTPTTNRIDR